MAIINTSGLKVNDRKKDCQSAEWTGPDNEGQALGMRDRHRGEGQALGRGTCPDNEGQALTMRDRHWGDGHVLGRLWDRHWGERQALTMRDMH